MDEKQLTALIQKVIERVQNESASDTTVLEKAYIILPDKWRERCQSQCVEVMHRLRGTYHTIGIVPDEDDDCGVLYAAGMCGLVKRSEVVFPNEDFLTVFPIASRNLIVKTALCIEDDFETEWIAKCLSCGRPIFMRKESPMFTGREASAYRKKIEAYYNDVASYGICLDRLPCDVCEETKAVAPAPVEVQRVSLPADPSCSPVTTVPKSTELSHEQYDMLLAALLKKSEPSAQMEQTRVSAPAVQQPVAVADPAAGKRVITTRELEGLEKTKVLQLNPGDIISPLAAERARERGIRFVY